MRPKLRLLDDSLVEKIVGEARELLGRSVIRVGGDL